MLHKLLMQDFTHAKVHCIAFIKPTGVSDD